MKKQKILKIAQISILASLSFIFYMIKFPIATIIPIFPSFLEIQFSNLPVIIAGFLLGPLEGSIVVVLRLILKLPFTHTLGVGEIADLIIGLATVISSSLIYRRFRNKRGAHIGLIVGAIAWVVFACLANWLVILPFYIEVVGFDAVLGMLKVIPGVNDSNYMKFYLLYAIIPFNLLLATLVSIVTSLVYKRVSKFLKPIGDDSCVEPKELKEESNVELGQLTEAINNLEADELIEEKTDDDSQQKE